MGIPKKLLKFKLLFLFALSFSLILVSYIYIAPSLLDILAYFWPLLVSTALFLIAVVVFGRTSPPMADISGEKAGEGILDFVAGQPEAEAEAEAEVESEPEPEKVQVQAEGSHEQKI